MARSRRDYQRWARRGTTTQRGLGHAHQADLKRLRAALIPGTPCWRCGLPMYPWQALNRDHLIDRALGGADGPAVLAHASCNKSAGATAGNRRRGQQRAAAKATASKVPTPIITAPLRTSRNW